MGIVEELVEIWLNEVCDTKPQKAQQKELRKVKEGEVACMAKP